MIAHPAAPVVSVECRTVYGIEECVKLDEGRGLACSDLLASSLSSAANVGIENQSGFPWRAASSSGGLRFFACGMSVHEA